MAKKQYITKKELKKCQQVADAYAKELEEGVFSTTNGI